jgi:beta-galactosidase
MALPLPAAGADAVAEVKIGAERRMSFNDGWRFFKGEAAGAEAPAFDDSKWTGLTLPHDWAIGEPFDRSLNPHTGALPAFGTGWYRKSFLLSDSAKGRYLSIEFDGAMSNAHVWLNGQELGSRPYGYTSFAFDLTPYLHFGVAPNVLAVRLTPEDHSSRWYPGAGIYRNVWLTVTGPVHVAHWGTYVTTPAVGADKSTVSVKTEIRNRQAFETHVTVRSIVLDASGKEVARHDDDAAVDADGAQTVAASLVVRQPELWDVGHPYLYRLVTELRNGNRVEDRYETPFGIRSIAFDKERGFFLNGRHRKLQGVCLHHDLGALGAAVNRRATERQLQIMKAAGVNAIRTSHNPPSPELLEFCDRMGLLVIDESFDMWRIPKVPNGLSKFYDEWSERDVRDFVRRDRNHPSIVMWSIGNEIPEQREPDGWKEARRLTGFFHEEDPTRPTTSAFNNWTGAIKNKLADEVDIPGFNYQPMRYAQIMKEHPAWTIFGTETASCVSSRGVYHLPIQKYEKHPSLEISSYDIVAPHWAYCPDVEFDAQDRLPGVLGEFVWTGFDYLGEPTPYFGERASNQTDWPARSSYFGMVDLAGFPKDRYYLYQSQWTGKPMVHLLPHWNWEGKEGQTIPVMCYTNADEVELILNGRSLGREKRFSEPWVMPVGPNVSPDKTFSTKYRLVWQVPYQAGTLRAVAYRENQEVAVDEVRTAEAPARIRLVPDRTVIQADGEDLSFVTVRVEDQRGNLCPLADNLVEFQIKGAGRIEAVDNGNPASTEPFQANHRKAFNGLALVIVRSVRGTAGTIQLTGSGSGLFDGTVTIRTQP